MTIISEARTVLLATLLFGFMIFHPTRAERNDDYYDTNSPINSLFRDCRFSIDDTTHFKRQSEPYRRYENAGIFIGCSTALRAEGLRAFNPQSNSIAFSSDLTVMIDRDDGSESIEAVFPRDKAGNRTFVGGCCNLTTKRFIKKRVQVANTPEGTTLVGRQRLTGSSLANGGIFTVSAATIIRTATNFTVRLQVAFDPLIPTAISEELIDELIVVVNSVKANE